MKDYYTFRDAIKFLAEQTGDSYKLKDLIPLAAKKKITPCFYFSGGLATIQNGHDDKIEMFNFIGYLTPFNTDYFSYLDQRLSLVRVDCVKIVEDCTGADRLNTKSVLYQFCFNFNSGFNSLQTVLWGHPIFNEYKIDQFVIPVRELTDLVRGSKPLKYNKKERFKPAVLSAIAELNYPDPLKLPQAKNGTSGVRKEVFDCLQSKPETQDLTLQVQTFNKYWQEMLNELTLKFV